MAKRQPKLLCGSGTEAKCLRWKMGLRQDVFWEHVGVSQSGGSRYESGRPVPDQVLWALHFVYGTEDQAKALLAWLRQPALDSLGGEAGVTPNEREDLPQPNPAVLSRIQLINLALQAEEERLELIQRLKPREGAG